MSQNFRRAGLLAMAGSAAVITLSAPAANAATSLSLDYRCKFPLIGTLPVQLDITADIPASWPPGVPTAPFAVTGTLTLQTSGLQSPFTLVEGLHVVGGVTEAQKPGKGTAARARVQLPDGTGVNVRVPLDIEPYVIVPQTPNPLVLNFSGTTPSLTLDTPGTTKLALTELILNLYARYDDGTPVEGFTTPPTDIDRLPYPDIDGDPGTFNVPCKLDPPTQNTQFPSPWIIPGPPTAPTALTATSTETTATLRWAASSDDGFVAQYDVYSGSTKVATTSGSTTATITGLQPDTEYTYTVRASDDEGQEGPASAPVAVKTKPDTTAPSAPVVTGAGGFDRTAFLQWTASTDNVGVAAYDVYVNGSSTPVATTTGLSATIPNVPVGGNPLTVIATDAAGNRSTPGSVTVAFPVVEEPVNIRYSYTLSGSTQLRTLTKGTLPLKGSIAAKLMLATGQVTADLTLNETSGRLVAAGFLPVTAKVGFSPSGQTTGTLVDGVLKTSSKVRIKVKEIKLFGAIPLAGGNNCQTKNLSEINLQSTQVEFLPLTGGPLAGTYKISDLNGCGALNGLVSPLTAGGGNTINLNLAPAPAAQVS